jgi:acetylornithine deacetylase/succinyl-diaminopimelate desuccinylase-like protein
MKSKIYQRNEGKANICATLDGKKPGKIMYLMHLDVVPEGDRDLWVYDDLFF